MRKDRAVLIAFATLECFLAVLKPLRIPSNEIVADMCVEIVNGRERPKLSQQANVKARRAVDGLHPSRIRRHERAQLVDVGFELRADRSLLLVCHVRPNVIQALCVFDELHHDVRPVVSLKDVEDTGNGDARVRSNEFRRQSLSDADV